MDGVAAGDTGIAHGNLLIEFAEAVLDTDEGRLDAARNAIVDALGSEALVDSAGVVGLFNAIDRIADATGAPLEDWKAEQTADLRDALGIGVFGDAKMEVEAAATAS